MGEVVVFWALFENLFRQIHLNSHVECSRSIFSAFKSNPYTCLNNRIRMPNKRSLLNAKHLTVQMFH